jgi:ribosomal-protein-alanine N-acetyltransferase
VKQFRRIEVPAPDTFARLQRGAIRSALITREAMLAIERERRDLVASDSHGLLVAEPRSGEYRLHYSFADRDAFSALFPSQLDRLLPALDPQAAPFGIFIRLADVASRPWVEPVLRACAFSLSHERLEMQLTGIPAAGSPESYIPDGYALRPATPNDADTIAQLDAISFPASHMLATHQPRPDVALAQIERAAALRILEDTSTGRAVGLLHLTVRPPSTGYVTTLAVHPDDQRRGLGEAMMRWTLAWFLEQGLTNAELTVRTDNPGAVALYRKLRFESIQAAVIYRRPIAKDEVRQLLESQRREHITVRRRF